MSSQGSVEEIFSLQASLYLTPDCVSPSPSSSSYESPSPSPALGKDLIPASTHEQLKVHWVIEKENFPCIQPTWYVSSVKYSIKCFLHSLQGWLNWSQCCSRM
jgi:hypothetical protein